MAEREEPKSKNGNLPRKMQIICKFWMMGNCIKDDKCEYLHNNSDFPSFKNQTNTQLPPECPMYSIGFCKNGPLCKFTHSKQSEDENPYRDILHNNGIDNAENSEILPMWFLEYFFEKPIGLIFEEFENDNAEEIESMKTDLNIDHKTNIFDYKKLSSKHQQLVVSGSSSFYSSNALGNNAFNSINYKQQNSNEQIMQNKKIERVGSAQNLISNLSNAENNLNTKGIIELKDSISLKDEGDNISRQFNNESLMDLPIEKDENLKDKSKNSENSSIKTSDSNSRRNTPANSNVNVNVFENFETEKNELSAPIIEKVTNSDKIEIIERKGNEENEEMKIESLNNFINEEININENKDSVAIEESTEELESDSLLKKMLIKYSFINFNFRNSNFVPNYNYTNMNNYKNYINSTHFQNGYDLKLEEKANKLDQKNLNNKNLKILGKGFNNKSNQTKPAVISEQKIEEINKCASLSNLGKSSFNRPEIMNYLLTKNYPNDIYAMKKISIVENLNLNVRYFFLRYKNFDLIRFSMETDLLIVLEENALKYLEALKNCDEVVLIYFDDITKDFYGFAKLKYQIEAHEVEEYLQESYSEVLDIFESQFQPKNFNSSYNKNKTKFSFIQVEWLWKTKLSFDKVEILKNGLKNYELFVDSEDGQEIASELGFYVCRLMIKRLTKDEVQEYLNTKKQLESEKIQTPFKSKTNENEKAEGHNVVKNYKALLSNNSNSSMNSLLTDSKTTKFNFTEPANFNNDNVNCYQNYLNNSNFSAANNMDSKAAYQQLRNNFSKLCGFNMNSNNNTNKGNMATMSNMNKIFFNQFMNGNYSTQVGNLQNFYAATNNIINSQEALKQTSNNSNFNENQKDPSKNNQRINPNLTNDSKKELKKDISKKINSDNASSVNSFNSINIEKMNINSSSNNLLQKFSQVSNNDKINLPEEIKSNFENIIFEKINNNYHNIPNLNNLKNSNNNINSNTNNNIIVTNISNLQVNISQNSYNNIDSDNRNYKDKSKKQSSKDKKHKRSSSSRARSRSKDKSYQEKRREKRDSNKEKKKKHKKNYNRDRSESFGKDKDKSFGEGESRNSSVEKGKEFIHNLIENQNEQADYDRKNKEFVCDDNTKKDKKQELVRESDKSFDLFDKDDELNIDKLLQENIRVQNEHENESYDSDVTVKNENTQITEKTLNDRCSIESKEELKEIVNSNPENTLLHHKRKRSVSNEKTPYTSNIDYYNNSNNFNYNNTYRSDYYFPRQTQSFSNSHFNNKSKEHQYYNKTNQNNSMSDYPQYDSYNRPNTYKFNGSSSSINNTNQHSENKLKSNKLFSNAIAKVTSSFLKEKKVSPNSFKRK